MYGHTDHVVIRMVPKDGNPRDAGTGPLPLQIIQLLKAPGHRSLRHGWDIVLYRVLTGRTRNSESPHIHNTYIAAEHFEPMLLGVCTHLLQLCLSAGHPGVHIHIGMAQAVRACPVSRSRIVLAAGPNPD